MLFALVFAERAALEFEALEANKALLKRYKATRKTLGFLETNPRHPSLNTHKYSDFIGPIGEDVFEAYCENRTPGAYRIFWYYGPGKNVITILAITPHP
jgi:hypothetical protein